MKKLSPFLLFIVMSNLYSQNNISIKLERSFDSKPITSVYMLESRGKNYMQDYKGIPKDLSDYRILSMDLHYSQTVFENYLSKKMSKRDSTHFKKIDVSKLSKVKTNHRIFVLSGFTNKGKIAIPDINNNYDFSDDSIIYFNDSQKSVANKKDAEIGTKLNFTFEDFNGKKIFHRSASFILQGSFDQHSYGENIDIEDTFTLYLRSNEHRVGIAKVDSLCYKFLISPTMGADVDFSNYAIVYTRCDKDFNKKYNFDDCTLKDDYLSLGTKKYKITVSRSGDSMTLSEIPSELYTQKEKVDFGGIAISNKNIQLSDYKGRYLLVDFWGTWCKPCLDDMPQLKAAQIKYAPQLSIVGVAYDKDVNKVKTFLDKNGYDWENLFEDSSLPSKEMNTIKFKVTSFPRMLLFNPTGEIIFDSVNTKVESLDKILNEFIN